MHTIPSGVPFLLPAKHTLRLLMLPGIGDLHWCMLKLQGMIRDPAFKPTVYVWNFDNRPRSLEFLQRVPFIKAGSYYNKTDRFMMRTKEFKGLYSTGTHDIVEGWQGFDFVIGFNGSLTVGKDFHRIVPNAAINWNYPLTMTGPERQARDQYRAQYGNYVMLFFSNHGMFTRWIANLSVDRIRTFVAELHRRLPNHRLLLTGSKWDAPFNEQLVRDGVVNLTGQTNLDQFLGLLRGAAAFCGFPGGNTIISTHLGIPTVMIWDPFFKYPGFRTNWVDPSKVNQIYHPMETTNFDIDQTVELLVRSVQRSHNAHP